VSSQEEKCDRRDAEGAETAAEKRKKGENYLP
jgi:hypothetical protein